jgi:hypothetical protein
MQTSKLPTIFTNSFSNIASNNIAYYQPGVLPPDGYDTPANYLKTFFTNAITGVSKWVFTMLPFYKNI